MRSTLTLVCGCPAPRAEVGRFQVHISGLSVGSSVSSSLLVYCLLSATVVHALHNSGPHYACWLRLDQGVQGRQGDDQAFVLQLV